MVLVTHHTQGSCAAAHLRTIPWSKGIRLNQNVVRLQMSSRTDRCLFQKLSSPLRPVARRIPNTRGKSLQISSFKGNIHNDDPGNGSSKSTLPKNSVKYSFVQQDSDEKISAAEEITVSNTSESNNTKSESLDIRGLFMKWLNALRTDVPCQVGDDLLKEPPQMDHKQESKEVSLIKKESKEASSNNRNKILKMVFCYFLRLDTTITVPLLIFVPFYLAINVIHGAEVSRELTPLWIIGPLVTALYVKLLRWIIALYVFSFKQTVKIISNLPGYFLMTCKYIFQGKLKEDIRAYVWQPVVNFKNLDYKELAKRKWKAFQEWIYEKYLDYVESIWPYYCRTIRFLKRANFI